MVLHAREIGTGLGHARERYGKLLVQWGVSCSMLPRSREQMVARRGLDRWWDNCLDGECKLAGKAWEQEHERRQGQKWEQELRRRRVEAYEGWEETGQEGWYSMVYGWRKSPSMLTDEERKWVQGGWFMA